MKSLFSHFIVLISVFFNVGSFAGDNLSSGFKYEESSQLQRKAYAVFKMGRLGEIESNNLVFGHRFVEDETNRRIASFFKVQLDAANFPQVNIFISSRRKIINRLNILTRLRQMNQEDL